MQKMNWVKKGCFWTFHSFIWVLLNIILGSLPFIIAFFKGKEDDPFLVGLLCFCFSVGSSGLYLILSNSHKGEHTGFAKAFYMFSSAFTFAWILGVWTFVLKLNFFLNLIGDDLEYKVFLFLYIFSCLIFFGSNYKSLSEIVNNHVSKYLIAETVSNSKENSNSIKASLKEEESF